MSASRRVPRNPSAQYRPQSAAWGAGAAYLWDGKPFFTYWDVPRVTRDPWVKFLIKLWTSPLRDVAFVVKADRPEVARFVLKTVKRFWTKFLPRLLRRYFLYGFAPAGLEYRVRRGKWELDRVRPVQPTEARVLEWKKSATVAGFETASTGPVIAPYAMWFSGWEEAAPNYDIPPVAGLFDPWLEKNTRGGALHLQQIYARKVSIQPGVIMHPPGKSKFKGSDGTEHERWNQDVAMEALEYVEAAANFVMENVYDDKGNPLWKFEPSKAGPDQPFIHEYPDQLDKRMAAGVGIPDEVLKAAETGSGYSGRKVPYYAWLGTADEMAGLIVDCLDTYCLRPLVWINYGNRAEYEVEPQSLVEKAKREDGGKGGQPPGSPAPPGAPPAGGGDDGQKMPYVGPRGGKGFKDGGGKVHYGPRPGFQMSAAAAAEPETGSRTAARVKQLLGPAAVSGHRAKSLVALAMTHLQEQAHEEGAPEKFGRQMDYLSSLAADPSAVEEITGGHNPPPPAPGTAPVPASGPGGPTPWVWSPGPRGGRRWYNAATGLYRYAPQDQQPGHEAAQPAAAPDVGKAMGIAERVGKYQHSPDDLRELAGHAHLLPPEKLRATRQALEGSFRNPRRRDDMVQSLLDHVYTVAEADKHVDGSAAHPSEPATPATHGPRLDGSHPEQPAVGQVPHHPVPGRVYAVHSDELHMDPARFQYKVTGIGREGVGDELKGVEWNPKLAGVVLAWRDPETGIAHPVNGHHRTHLRKASGGGLMNVMFSEAPDAKTARSDGALMNIAEGRGSAVDAAKYMRDTGGTIETLQRAGVSLRGKVAADAVHLKNLSDNAFAKVVRGQLDEPTAVAVGKHLADPKLQDLLFKKIDDREADGRSWGAREVEQAAKKMAAAGTVTETGKDLFGEFADEKSTFDQEVELEHHVGRHLAQEANDFASVASQRRADRVSGAGNVLTVDENQKRADEAAADAETYHKLVHRSGPLARAIKHHAGELATARTPEEKNDVRRRTVESVRSAVKAELAGTAAGEPVPADAGGVGGVGGPGQALPGGGGGPRGPRERQAWQVNLEDFQNHYAKAFEDGTSDHEKAKRAAAVYHHASVLSALEGGQKPPARVLIDYPDLANDYREMLRRPARTEPAEPREPRAAAEPRDGPKPTPAEPKLAENAIERAKAVAAGVMVPDHVGGGPEPAGTGGSGVAPGVPVPAALAPSPAGVSHSEPVDYTDGTRAVIHHTDDGRHQIVEHDGRFEVQEKLRSGTFVRRHGDHLSLEAAVGSIGGAEPVEPEPAQSEPAAAAAAAPEPWRQSRDEYVSANMPANATVANGGVGTNTAILRRHHAIEVKKALVEGKRPPLESVLESDDVLGAESNYPQSILDDYPELAARDTARKAAPAPIPPTGPVTDPHVSLASDLAAQFAVGEHPKTSKDLFDLADEHHGGTRAEGKYGPSDAYDSLEAGLNLHLLGRTDPTQGLEAAQMEARRLSEKVKALPTQTNRSGNKDSFQQFSTPPHYAYAAAWAANLKPGEHVLEPSAGTGSLAVQAKNAGAVVHTNELDPRRTAFLKHLDLGGTTHTENAEQIAGILPQRGVKPTAVVMNPPFSQTAGRLGDKKDILTGANHISEALRTLAPGGRLVAIVGEGMTPENSRYRQWFGDIRQKYHLKANVGVSGDEYKKYGTGFGTRMLVIDKAGPHTGETVTGDAKDIPDLMALLEGVRNDRSATGEQPPGEQTGGGLPAADGGPAPAGADAAPAPRYGVPDAEAAGLPVAGGSDGAAPGSAPDGDVPAGVRGEPDLPEPGRPGGGSVVEGPVADAVGGDGQAAAGPAVGRKPRGGRKAVGGEPVPRPAGNVPQLRPPAPLVIEHATPAVKPVGGPSALSSNADLGASLYETYKPAKLAIPGAHAHATPLVESAAMAAVQPPDPTYRPHFSPDVVEKGMLSSAGLESVVYAGQAHEKFLQPERDDKGNDLPPARRGYFIGDGTGAGKGRQVAGVIADNWNQGRRKHVWVSQKQSLLKDAHRDWRDVGNDPKDLHHFDDIRNKAEPPTEGVTFVTYDTLKGRPKDPTAPSNLDTLVNHLGPDFDGVIAFDEAHSMANGLDRAGERGEEKASQRARAGIELQNRLPKARVLYVSATGATEVGNLAYAERLGLWGRGTPFSTKQEFVNSMEQGGVAAMEAVAQSLKATGGYAARSLSFDDGTENGRVTYDRLTHKLTDDQKGTYDSLADAWQSVLKNIDAVLANTGAGNNPHAKSAAKSQFWGAQQRFFNQLMTSMQTPSVIREMEKDIAEGRAPVVQLVNTMEAAANRARARLGDDEDLDRLDVSPREVLAQYLEKSFPVHRYQTVVDPNTGNETTQIVEDADGNPVVDPEAAATRDALMDMVGTLKIPEGPLDMVVNHFGHEHVAEATGRKERVIFQEQPDGSRKKVIDRRPDSANTAEASAFQSGKKKVMVFSDAGGTGSSYHADRNAANQKQRVHYMLQPGWRADNAVQGLGRTHRTNQVIAPSYRLVEIDQLKAQKRFISTIARRLDQLGALTKGQRQTGSSGLFSAADNLESPQARQAMESFFRNLKNGQVSGLNYQEVMSQLGLYKTEEENLRTGRRGKAEQEMPDSMGQFLNRLLSLRVDLQGQVFDEYDKHLKREVERAALAGELDKGVENFPADKIAEQKDEAVYTHPDSGAEARLLSVKATRKNENKRPWKANTEGEKPLTFVQNRQSGRVWAVYKGADRTDARSGIIHPQVILKGPGSRQVKDENDVRWEGSYGVNHDRLDEAEAKRLWEEEYKQVSDADDTTEHFVTGALLPIWDKIPGQQPRIYRVRTDAGRTVVGRHVHADHVDTLLKNLGKSVTAQTVSAANAHAKIMTGRGRATLSNGWRLIPSRVGGEKRVELDGVSPGAIRELMQDGVIKERVGGYDTRYFIPAGDEGVQVLERVLKSRNATITGLSDT